MQQLYPHIVADADILAGKPVIEGTDVPASVLIAEVAEGKSFVDVAQKHGVTTADVRAALEYAARRTDEVVTSPAANVPIPTGAELSAAALKEAQAAGLDLTTISPLGRQLLEQRARIIADGEPLLSSWDEIDAEVAERRSC